MSRVEEALRRAAAAPRLAGAGHQVAERPAERWDRSVLDNYPAEGGTVSTVETRVVPVTPVLPGPGKATVPDCPVSTRFSKAYHGKLVADGGAPLASIEEYRRLAATLHHHQAEQGLKTLMVTSAVPQEGKTLTVVNLAMTLSESYRRRVLLIDADLRRPSVHDIQNRLQRRPGTVFL